MVTERRVLRAHSQRMRFWVTATAGGTSGEAFRRYPCHLCHGDGGQSDSNSLLRRLSKQPDWFGAEDRRPNTRPLKESCDFTPELMYGRKGLWINWG